MFSSVKIDGRKATPDCVYYNGTIINNSLSSTQTTDDPEIDFEDSRQTPLVLDSSDYQVSVQSFTLNGATRTLPLFIPQIIPDATDVTTTIYTITFSTFYNSTYLTNTQNIIWVPENQASFTKVPTTSLPVQQESDYYYCYTYTHWISLVNKALRLAWTICGGGTTFGTQCAWFEYDEDTGLFSFNQDSKTCMTPVGVALIPPFQSATQLPVGTTYYSGDYSFVGINTCLEGLLSNFPAIYYGSGQLWNSQAGKFLPEVVIDTGLTINLKTAVTPVNGMVGVTLKSTPKTSIFQLANPFTGAAIADSFFVRLIQDYSSTGLSWSPVGSLVLGTTQIHVRNEAMGNPIVLGDSNLGSISTSGSFQKVLVEFSINAKQSDLWKGFILYEPFVPTFSSLDPSHAGISDIDLQLGWRNRLTNSIIPLKLPNQASVSFRLLFKRKLTDNNFKK